MKSLLVAALKSDRLLCVLSFTLATVTALAFAFHVDPVATEKAAQLVRSVVPTADAAGK